MSTPKNCTICNKIFYPLTAEVNRGRGKFCSPLCRHTNQSVVMRNRTKTPETCAKLSLAHKGRIRTKQHSLNISKGLLGKYAGESNGNWRGGKYKSLGRWFIRVNDHPNKYQNGYILFSRYIVEQFIGHYLLREEHVHHINFQKDDDRPENLYIFPSESEHTTYHQLLKSGKADLITDSNLSNYQ